MKLTFDKEVRGMKVKGGKNEKCNGKICTFTQQIREPLRKGQKLELAHRLGFNSPGAAQVTEIEFNGEMICGSKTFSPNEIEDFTAPVETTKPISSGKFCKEIDRLAYVRN